MEKTKGLLGVVKRVRKKSPKKRLLNKVVDYLKSDYHMFAPLVSCQLSDVLTTNKLSASSSSGVGEALKPIQKKNKTLLNKVEEYLKSDHYMYSPIVDPQSRGDLAAASPLEGTQTTSSLPGNFLKGTDHSYESVTKVPLDKASVVRETFAVKHIVHQNSRPSSVPGKRVIETRRRKRVE